MWEERFAVLRGFGRVRLVRDPSVSMRRLGESPPQSHPSSRPILCLCGRLLPRVFPRSCVSILVKVLIPSVWHASVSEQECSCAANCFGSSGVPCGALRRNEDEEDKGEDEDGDEPWFSWCVAGKTEETV